MSSSIAAVETPKASKDVLVRQVPTDILKKFKIYAIQRDLSLSKAIIDAMKATVDGRCADPDS